MASDPLLSRLADFRYHLRRFLIFSERAAGETGLLPQQHQLLLQLAGAPDGVQPTISFCAERLGIRHHSAVELVDRCAKSGWLERTPSAFDGRSVLIRLTPRAQQVLDQLSAEHARELGESAPALIGALHGILQQTSSSNQVPRA